MFKKSVSLSPSALVNFLDTAKVNLQTEIPLVVCVNSGSLVKFPIIIALAYTFIQCVRFVMSLIFYAIISLGTFVGSGAAFISIFILLLLLFLCLIRFVSLKSDKGKF